MQTLYSVTEKVGASLGEIVAVFANKEEAEKAVTARRETMQEQEVLATKLEIVPIVLVDKPAEVGDHIIVVGKIEDNLDVVPQVAYAEPESLEEYLKTMEELFRLSVTTLTVS